MKRTDDISFKENTSKNLKALLAESGITEAQLGEKTGISRSALNRIKNGQVCPDVGQASAIASFFKIAIDDLVCGDVSITSIGAEKDHAVVIEVNKDSEISIIGVSELNEFSSKKDSVFGIKASGGFNSSLFDENTILLVEVKDKPVDGEMCLIQYAGSFVVANFINRVFSKIENPLFKMPSSDSMFIGGILKIEKSYSTSKNLTKSIVDKIGGFAVAGKKYKDIIYGTA